MLKTIRIVIGPFLSLLAIAICTSSWAMEPLCKAMMSKRSYDEAVSLIAQESDINIACNPDSKIKAAVPLDMAIESAAVNPKAPELAALLLEKGAMVGGYRKDVFFFRDPKRQQEFESKPIGTLFAITPEETRFTMYMWKTYIEEKAEAHRQEFLERARQQDAATFAMFGKVLLGMASTAVTYQALKNGASNALPQALDQVSKKSGAYTAPLPISNTPPGTASMSDTLHRNQESGTKQAQAQNTVPKSALSTANKASSSSPAPKTVNQQPEKKLETKNLAANSCNTNVGEVVKTTKEEYVISMNACKKADSTLSTRTWGTDAGSTHGTPEGSCKMARQNGYARTACYCFETRNPGESSAVDEGDWVCWIAG
ncbi:hypothetical protein [Herbaspirillum sp.]|uniref:hypothetical protein n=1 Tax=Herbaspirillum sp. TaxID=1890675 RepID=UPI001B05C80B|nr:hypothetical protein [Herbaspirillum sp.]MBO9537692.1 hypothetical protein [Herbaspirillum sp.]